MFYDNKSHDYISQEFHKVVFEVALIEKSKVKQDQPRLSETRLWYGTWGAEAEPGGWVAS